jgi:hypothetical protein
MLARLLLSRLSCRIVAGVGLSPLSAPSNFKVAEDPIQKPVPYAARLYTDSQEKKLEQEIGSVGVHLENARQAKRNAAGTIWEDEGHRLH